MDIKLRRKLTRALSALSDIAECLDAADFLLRETVQTDINTCLRLWLSPIPVRLPRVTVPATSQ